MRGLSGQMHSSSKRRVLRALRAMAALVDAPTPRPSPARTRRVPRTSVGVGQLVAALPPRRRGVGVGASLSLLSRGGTGGAAPWSVHPWRPFQASARPPPRTPSTDAGTDCAPGRGLPLRHRRSRARTRTRLDPTREETSPAPAGRSARSTESHCSSPSSPSAAADTRRGGRHRPGGRAGRPSR